MGIIPIFKNHNYASTEKTGNLPAFHLDYGQPHNRAVLERALQNVGSTKASLRTLTRKRKGLINISKKNEALRRKEIVYTSEEWKQIEDRSKAAHLKTATFIRAMSLNGDVYVVDLKELAPLLNGMRIMSNNVNQVAKKANETNNIFAVDVETLREEVGRLCRTVSQWLSTVTLTKP